MRLLAGQTAIVLTIAATLFAADVSAQALTFGSITGTVTDRAGGTVPNALVTLTSTDTGEQITATASGSGRFTMRLLRAGSYEARVEAIGYRPLVARAVTLAGSQSLTLSLPLTPATPPVTQVDTLVLGVSASSRIRDGGLRVGRSDLAGLPIRSDDLAGAVALSSAYDASLGSQGLPGDMTLIVADGVPFHRAPHPTARQELNPDGLFPRGALQSVTAYQDPPRIDRTGAAGGFVEVGSRSTTRDRGLELEAAYSGDPAWSSDQLAGDVPALVSFQGGLRGTAVVDPATSQVVLAAEALRHQTPIQPRIGEMVAASLSGLDADALTALGEPAVESYSRYGGLARFDGAQGSSGRTFLRAAGSFEERTFDGPGPIILSPLAAPEETTVGVSVAGGLVQERSADLTLELRGGFSGSYRDFAPSRAEATPAYLTTEGVGLGGAFSTGGKSSRRDIVLTPALRYTVGDGVMGLGLDMRLSSHTMTHSPAARGELIYADAAALQAERGFGYWTTAPEVSFRTQQYGVFVGYDVPVSPTLEVSAGIRYDLELVPGSDVEPNPDWLAVSGLANEEVATSFNQLGAHAGLVWIPSPEAGTRVSISWSLRDADLDTRWLGAVLAEDVGATSTRVGGPGIAWPEGDLPSSAPTVPTLTLLGPDSRAPRTVGAGIDVSQPIGEAGSFFFRASNRRTDFLMRRRNLNLPVAAAAVDPFGRSVMGTLLQDGAAIAVSAEDSRRFEDFGEVWALDPDGWSEYRGVTVGLEAGASQVDLFGSYTWSETTDNWVGARDGLAQAMLDPGLPEEPDRPWSEDVSDFDVTHRVAAGVSLAVGPATLSGLYRFASGLPFTPGYRVGVDANGDGSPWNDVAYVPTDTQLGMLLGAWPCLEDQAGSFAARNSCRGPGRHSVDVRIRFDFGELGGRPAALLVDGLNLVESEVGVRDEALLIVDPNGTLATGGGTVTIPFVINPDFGRLVYPSSRGRMIRIGMRIG